MAAQMVANAGICHFVPVIDTTVEQWESTIAVNARSVLLAIKYAARQMIAQGRGGRIIGEKAAVLSTAAKDGTNLTRIPAAASSVAGKQGMRSPTKSACPVLTRCHRTAQAIPVLGRIVHQSLLYAD